jgi:transposase
VVSTTIGGPGCALSTSLGRDRVRVKVKPADEDERNERRRRVSDLYASGLTAPQVGARLGVSEATVRLDLKALGVAIRPRGGGSHAEARARETMIEQRRARVASLYNGGMTTREVARELEVSQATVAIDVGALGVARPARRPPKYALPKPRECAHCGDAFTPKYPSAAIGDLGRYCSAACRVEGLRKHPRADERVCARPGCETTFRPAAAALLRGGGRGTYCSQECRRTGQTIACAHCGKELYLPASHVARARFCSRRCWGLYRWQHTEALETLARGMHRSGLLRGHQAQRVLGAIEGRLGARLAGRAGGKLPVEETPTGAEKAKKALNLHANGNSLRSIARITGLTKRQVEGVLARSKLSP